MITVYRLYPEAGPVRVVAAFVGTWDHAYPWFVAAGCLPDRQRPGNTLRVFVDAAAAAGGRDPTYHVPLSPHALAGRPILRAEFDPYWRFVRPYLKSPVVLRP